MLSTTLKVLQSNKSHRDIWGSLFIGMGINKMSKRDKIILLQPIAAGGQRYVHPCQALAAPAAVALPRPRPRAALGAAGAKPYANREINKQMALAIATNECQLGLGPTELLYNALSADVQLLQFVFYF